LAEHVELFNKWAAKTGLTLEAITNIYDSNYRKLITEHPELLENVELLKKRALRLTYIELKARLRSRREPWGMLVLGFGDKADLTARMRLEALQKYEEDKLGAIQRKIVRVEEDGTVVPLDTRKEIRPKVRNPNFGKPLVPVYRRYVVGLGCPLHGGPVKLTWLTLRHDNADIILQPGRCYSFVGLKREETANRYLVYDAPRAMFNIMRTKIDVFGDVTEQTVWDLLSEAPPEFESSIAELMDFHTKYENDRFHPAIVEGDIVSMTTTSRQ